MSAWAATSSARDFGDFNRGELWRDFIYIDDIAVSILRALDQPAGGTPPHKVPAPRRRAPIRGLAKDLYRV
jgi:nucleoside-diphosphate-sugar epimerase